jgi:membrane associated rhomboid family serine protease
LIPLKDNIPTRRFPVLTVALIVINVFVFVFLQHGGHIGFGAPNNNNLVRWGLIPYEVTHPGKHCDLVAGGQVACEGQTGVSGNASSQPNTWLTMITSIFMHGGLLHIAGNMLFLWIFGNNIEDSMARWRFVLFYLLGGIVANFAQIAVGPNSTAPGIGASGAIAAVLGGYALLYPRARVITAVILIFFITLLDLPALLVLGGWFVLQLLDAAVNSPLGGGVAYFAHIGGFLFGLLLIKLFADRVNTDYQRVNRLPVY